MSANKSDKGVIRLLQRLFNDAVAVQGISEGDEGDVNRILNLKAQKSDLRTFFEARCNAYLEEKGDYCIPTKQYLPFMINGVLYNGKDHPLVSGEYKSVDQLMNFHLSLQKYGFDVESKWKHNLDGSIELDNPFREKGLKLHVAGVHYWRHLLNLLNKPIFSTKEKNNTKFFVNSSSLVSVKGERFVLEYGGGHTLSFGHIDQLLYFQNLVKEPAVMEDFSSLQSLQTESDFTVRSGTYKSLVDYSNFWEKAKTENISVVKNHTLEGGFELTVGDIRGVFTGWEDYRTLRHMPELVKGMVKRNNDGSISVNSTETETESAVDPMIVFLLSSNFKDLETFDSFWNDCLKEGIGKVHRPNETDPFLLEFRGKLWKDDPEKVISIRGDFKSFQQFSSFKDECANHQIFNVINHRSSDGAFEVANKRNQYGGWFKDMEQYIQLRNDIAAVKNELDHGMICGHRVEGSFWVNLSKADKNGESSGTTMSNKKLADKDEEGETARGNQVARRTKISGCFKNAKELLAFRQACYYSNIPVASHKNPKEFTTAQGSFKSIGQYKILHDHPDVKRIIDKVFGHTTAGRFRIREDFDWIVREENTETREKVPAWESVLTKEIVTEQPTEGKIKPLWHCTKELFGPGFKYTSCSDKTVANYMPDEFQYPDANFTVRYDRWAKTMFWIHNDTGESYNEAPPNWDGPNVESRPSGQCLGTAWWGLICLQLKQLTAAEVFGMDIMDTPLSESYGVDINIATIIASFLVSKGEIDEWSRFEVLEMVHAQWKNSSVWYTAQIAKVNDDGKTFAVRYEDGDFWDKCPCSQLRKSTEPYREFHIKTPTISSDSDSSDSDVYLSEVYLTDSSTT